MEFLEKPTLPIVYNLEDSEELYVVSSTLRVEIVLFFPGESGRNF